MKKDKNSLLHEFSVEVVTFHAVSLAGADTVSSLCELEDSHTRWRQHFPFGGINQSVIITLPLTRFPEKAAVPSVNELRGGTLAGPLHCELSLVMRLSRTLLPLHFISDGVLFHNSKCFDLLTVVFWKWERSSSSCKINSIWFYYIY